MVGRSILPKGEPGEAEDGALEGGLVVKKSGEAAYWSFLNEGIIVMRVWPVDAVKAVGCVSNRLG